MQFELEEARHLVWGAFMANLTDASVEDVG